VTPIVEIEQVHRDQGDRLYYALLAYSGDPEVARDALAEAFARALTSAATIRDVVPWVWRVAFRLAASSLKDRRRFSEALDSDQVGPEPSGLFEALSHLSERQRASIVLHYCAGYSLDEVAMILGTRKGTVGVHLHRGRARLRELLEYTMDDLGERLREVEVNPLPDVWDDVLARVGRHDLGEPQPSTKGPTPGGIDRGPHRSCRVRSLPSCPAG
jgi:DNA-directed RNA polymerase specialized sigma24 family protein